MAEARSIGLQVKLAAEGLTILAPAAWIDQLIGVLLDNARKFAPRIFDRFRQGQDGSARGTGLGLAIADAILRATDGRRQVTRSPIGGARSAVSWAAGLG